MANARNNTFSTGNKLHFPVLTALVDDVSPSSLRSAGTFTIDTSNYSKLSIGTLTFQNCPVSDNTFGTTPYPYLLITGYVGSAATTIVEGKQSGIMSATNKSFDIGKYDTVEILIRGFGTSAGSCEINLHDVVFEGDGGSSGGTTTPNYTVKFYNESTLLQTVTVAQGGTAAYTGATPTKSGYTFIGWDKSLTNVQSDMSVYAQFEQNSTQPTYYTVTLRCVNQNGTELGRTTRSVTAGSQTFSAPSVYNHYSTPGNQTVNVTGNQTVTFTYTGNYYTCHIVYRRRDSNGMTMDYEMENKTFTTQYPNSVGTVFSGAPATIGSADYTQMSDGTWSATPVTVSLFGYSDVNNNVVSVDSIKGAVLTDNTAKWYANYRKK